MWPRLKLEAAACIRSEVLEDDGASLVLFTAVIWLFAVKTIKGSFWFDCKSSVVLSEVMSLTRVVLLNVFVLSGFPFQTNGEFRSSSERVQRACSFPALGASFH